MELKKKHNNLPSKWCMSLCWWRLLKLLRPMLMHFNPWVDRSWTAPLFSTMDLTLGSSFPLRFVVIAQQIILAFQLGTIFTKKTLCSLNKHKFLASMNLFIAARRTGRHVHERTLRPCLKLQASQQNNRRQPMELRMHRPGPYCEHAQRYHQFWILFIIAI